MQVTVIDNKTNESHVCSKSEAARMLGVRYETILRWSKKTNHIEQYNNFQVVFKTTIYKQPKQFKKGIKIV